MNQLSEKSAAYMSIILDSVYEYGTEFPYCIAKKLPPNHDGEHYILITAGHVHVSPAGTRFTTVKLGRLYLTKGALKLRLDTG
jgi:hypothetical protein